MTEGVDQDVVSFLIASGMQTTLRSSLVTQLSSGGSASGDEALQVCVYLRSISSESVRCTGLLHMWRRCRPLCTHACMFTQMVYRSKMESPESMYSFNYILGTAAYYFFRLQCELNIACFPSAS
jgi:hypothetical protein